MLPVQWEQRILHSLREVEIDLRKAQVHGNTPGLEQVQEDVAVLRTVIETAFEQSHKRA